MPLKLDKASLSDCVWYTCILYYKQSYIYNLKIKINAPAIYRNVKYMFLEMIAKPYSFQHTTHLLLKTYWTSSVYCELLRTSIFSLFPLYAGDVLRWEQQIRLRQMLTRQYLCIDSRSEVSLVTDPGDPRTVFRLHSVLKVFKMLLL